MNKNLLVTFLAMSYLKNINNNIKNINMDFFRRRFNNFNINFSKKSFIVKDKSGKLNLFLFSLEFNFYFSIFKT